MGHRVEHWARGAEVNFRLGARITQRPAPGPTDRRADGRGLSTESRHPRLPEPRAALARRASQSRTASSCARRRCGGATGRASTLGWERMRPAAPAEPRAPRARQRSKRPGAVAARWSRRTSTGCTRQAASRRVDGAARRARTRCGAWLRRRRESRTACRRASSRRTRTLHRRATCRPRPTATPEVLAAEAPSITSSCRRVRRAAACSSRTWSSSATTCRARSSSEAFARSRRGGRAARRSARRSRSSPAIASCCARPSAGSPSRCVNRGPVRGEEHAALKVEASTGATLDALASRLRDS